MCALRLIPRCATTMKTEWDIESAIATYNVEGWGEGYFTVNNSGNVEARPLKNDGGSIDLLEVVNEARARNLGFPLLIRFQDLLRHRVEAINRAFQSAISEFGYQNHYRGVFPIKVNQLREVVEEIVDAGEQFHFGLEAGSKPELVAALAMQKDHESWSKSFAHRTRSASSPTLVFVLGCIAKAQANGRRAAARTPSSVSTPPISWLLAKC